MRSLTNTRLIRRILVIASAISLLLLAACAPEGQRERGGGAGGDIQNTGQVIQMHGDGDNVQRVYYDTPAMGLGLELTGRSGAVQTEP